MSTTLPVTLSLNTGGDSEWMTTSEAAAYAKTTRGSLATFRYMNQGPKYYKPSPRKVLYKKSDLDAWLESTSKQVTK